MNWSNGVKISRIWLYLSLGILVTNCGPISPSVDKSEKKSGSSRFASPETNTPATSTNQKPDFVLGVLIELAQPRQQDPSINPSSNDTHEPPRKELLLGAEALASFKENYFCFLNIQDSDMSKSLLPEIVFAFADNDQTAAAQATSSPFQVSITQIGPNFWLLKLEQQELISRAEYLLLKDSLREIHLIY